MTAKTFGYERRGQVPGSNAKSCPKCQKWFAPEPRQRVCDGCRPRWQLAKRAEQREHLVNGATLGHDTRKPLSLGVSAGKRVVKNGFVEVFSDYLNLTYRCPVREPRAKRLETIVLSHEEAARQRWEHKGHAPGERVCASC